LELGISATYLTMWKADLILIQKSIPEEGAGLADRPGGC
jgi:hypothetical protein